MVPPSGHHLLPVHPLPHLRIPPLFNRFNLNLARYASQTGVRALRRIIRPLGWYSAPTSRYEWKLPILLISTMSLAATVHVQQTIVADGYGTCLLDNGHVLALKLAGL